MAVVKSDAMLQHEKWIAEVVKARPKRTKETKMLPEPIILVMAAAVILVIIATITAFI